MALNTGLSSWILAIVHALEDAGVDHVSLLRELGMDPDRVGDLNHRYLQHQVTPASPWSAKQGRDRTCAQHDRADLVSPPA